MTALTCAGAVRSFAVRNVPSHVGREKLQEALRQELNWQVIVCEPQQGSPWRVTANCAPPSFSPTVKGRILTLEEVTGSRSTLPVKEPSVKTYIIPKGRAPGSGGPSYAAAAGATTSKHTTAAAPQRHTTPAPQAGRQPATGQQADHGPSLLEWMKQQEQRQAAWQERMERQQQEFQAALLASVNALRGGQPTSQPNKDVAPGVPMADPTPTEACIAENAVLRNQVEELQSANEVLLAQQTTLTARVTELAKALERLQSGSAGRNRDTDRIARDTARNTRDHASDRTLDGTGKQ